MLSQNQLLKSRDLLVYNQFHRKNDTLLLLRSDISRSSKYGGLNFWIIQTVGSLSNDLHSLTHEILFHNHFSKFLTCACFKIFKRPSFDIFVILKLKWYWNWIFQWNSSFQSRYTWTSTSKVELNYLFFLIVTQEVPFSWFSIKWIICDWKGSN